MVAGEHRIEGRLGSCELQACCEAAVWLNTHYPDVRTAISATTPTAWLLAREKAGLDAAVACVVTAGGVQMTADEWLGSLERDYPPFRSPVRDAALAARAEKEYHAHLARAGYSALCRLRLSCAANPAIGAADVQVAVRGAVAPHAVANFRSLCRGDCPAPGGGRVGYASTPVLRVVPHAYFQCGDVTADKWGTGISAPISAFGGCFPDETIGAVRHAAAGVVGYANDGRPHTSASQFYVTTAPFPALDTRAVSFGEVVAGLEIVRAVGALEPAANGKPATPCHIEAAGDIALVPDA